MKREHFGFVLATGLAVFLASVQVGAAGATPEGGEYADAGVGATDSDLRFKLNPAATKIKPGASLQGGFECAKKTVFVRAKIPVSDNAFSFKGPVESATGKPKGTLRWSGGWTADDRVGGEIRLKKGNCSSGDVEWEAARPPGVPGGLTAATASDTEISLAWDSAMHAQHYVVGRATAAGGPYTDVETTTDTQFEDSGLSPSTTYFYVVRSANAAGESATSAEASAATLAACVDSGTDDLPAGATNLGLVDGDNGGDVVSANGSICEGDTDWYKVTVFEGSSGVVDLTARADLTMSPAFPAGDLELRRYCHTAAGATAASTNGGTTSETLSTGRDDEGLGEDSSFVLLFEVDGAAADERNTYSLTITGNVATTNRSCNA